MADSDRVDAERWRAFLSSDRISVLGTGGKGATMHIGLEIWGEHSHMHQERLSKPTAEARRLLNKYADDRRKEGHGR